MSDLDGNTEDRFSHNEAQLIPVGTIIHEYVSVNFPLVGEALIDLSHTCCPCMKIPCPK